MGEQTDFDVGLKGGQWLATASSSDRRGGGAYRKYEVPRDRVAQVADERLANISDLSGIKGGEELDRGDAPLFGRDAVIIAERIEDGKVGQRVNGGVEKL